MVMNARMNGCIRWEKECNMYQIMGQESLGFSMPLKSGQRNHVIRDKNVQYTRIVFIGFSWTAQETYLFALDIHIFI